MKFGLRINWCILTCQTADNRLSPVDEGLRVMGGSVWTKAHMFDSIVQSDKSS